MASKRVSQSAVNWAALAERVPAEQKVNLATFKVKSDGYLRRVLANPAAPPKLDWSFYKNYVPVAGMVDNFQKQYESLKISYPVDNLTPKIDQQWANIKGEIQQFIKESNNRISGYQKEIVDIKALLPYDQMTMEDFAEAHKDTAFDPINKPTFWPHTPEEQIGYEDKDASPTSAH